MNDQSPGPRRVKTALYVDFDNIYIGLRQLNPVAAKRFATNPSLWLGWIERGMPTGGDAPGHARSVLMRRCYLNPRTFADYRDNFTRTAFTVVDCPSLTGTGKNSTDIHIVMDVLDTLYRFTHFEEFVLLSGDSDFTPVLLRLRAFDRRTSILTIGTPPSAYAAASDVVLGGAAFIRDGLGIGEPAASVVTRAAPAHVAPPAAAPRAPSAAAVPINIKERILAFIKRFLDDSAEAVKLVVLASKAREVLGQEVVETKWGGAGTFKRLLMDNTDRGWVLRQARGKNEAYVLDPSRHAPPAEPPAKVGRGAEAESPADAAPATAPPAHGAEVAGGLADLTRRVGRAAGTPALPPAAFLLLEEELRKGPLNDLFTPRVVREACTARGVQVSRTGILKILKLMEATSASFRHARPQYSAADLARLFHRRTVELSAAAGLALSAADEELLREWLLDGVAARGDSGSHAGDGERVGDGGDGSDGGDGELELPVEFAAPGAPDYFREDVTDDFDLLDLECPPGPPPRGDDDAEP